LALQRCARGRLAPVGSPVREQSLAAIVLGRQLKLVRSFGGRTMTVLAVALFVVVPLVPAFPAKADDGVEELLRKAGTALRAGKTDEALALADKAVEADPKSARAYAFRGSLYEALRRFPAALADLDRAVELDPKMAAAYDQRGSVHFKLGNLDKSLADFDRFL